MKILFLPVWVVDLVRLARLRELSPRERRGKIGRVFLAFSLLAYLPLILGALATLKIPVWWVWVIPLPVTGIWWVNAILCLYCNFVLNVLARRALAFVPMSDRVRVALVQCGFRVPGIEGSPVEYPEVLAVDHRRVILAGKGFTPAHFEGKRAELGSAAGVFFWGARAARNGNGEVLPGIVELLYTRGDLPGVIPWEAAPVARWGAVVLGLSVSGWRAVSWQELIHVLVAGLTGSGKSVFLRGVILQFMAIHTRAVVVMLDFKGGAEGAAFSSMGNFVLCDDFQTAAVALGEVFREYARRVALLRSLNLENVYQVRGPEGERVNPVLVVVDEAAEVFLALDKRGEAETIEAQRVTLEILGKLARLSRAAGIHLVIATQRPDAKTIPPEIRSMMKSRIMFRAVQKEDSIMVLGRDHAVDLPDVAGRFLVALESGEFEQLQAVYVDKNQVRQILGSLPGVESELYKRIIKAIAQDKEGKSAEPERTEGAKRRTGAEA